MILVLGIIGIVNIGNTDLDKGKVKLKSASIEKLKSSVIESKGYEEITYPVLYELEKVEGIEERNVIIKGTLTKEENKYARFKEITSKTITSTVSENGREIEIRIEKVKLGRQNKINIKIEINGAINETKIKPEIEIKEESEKEYTKVNTGEIEVKTNSVTGLVQDEEGMSVSNLELSINKGNEEIRRTYTDENGRYVFSDVEEGKYTIKVEEENYELKEVKEVKRARLTEYKKYRPNSEYHEGRGVWSVKCDIALPCATQNELLLDDAKQLVANGVVAVAEGANMPTSIEATEYLQDNDVLFGPGKASNAGGVATSALEMAQNSQRLSWDFDKVDKRLKVIMENIFANVDEAAKTYGFEKNYVVGANIAGFEKVVDAMNAQGIV